MAALQHPDLGQIRGKLGNGVTQYLGIKYASLKHRFGIPELYEGSRSPIDATKVGAAVNDIPGPQAEYGLIQQSLDLPDFPPQSDTEGLNLTITAPEDTGSKKLPVFVFIHGGALATGSGTWPQYDHAAFVRQSVKLGKPVIGVNINYRTNIFGFLTSKELREAGFSTNNGLRDQKVAFQWVKKYIGGFNGDSENVTAVGQSAGGASATLLLQSREPLFKRLVDMSGTFLLLRPLSPEVHEIFYQQFCEAQSLIALTGKERLAAIEKLSSRELLLNVPPSIPSLPVLDNDVLRSSPTFESAEEWSTKGENTLPGLKWCKELLIGDCQLDGNIYQLALGHRRDAIAKQLERSFKRQTTGKELEIDSLLKAYSISTSKNDQEAYHHILELGNDICFYLPEEIFAQNFPGETYVYHFNEPNPWDGPFKGHSTHIFDVVLLFKNFDHKLEAAVKAVGEAYGNSIITFINGEAPWKVNSKSNPVAQVFGKEAMSGKTVNNTSKKCGRRDTIFEYKESIGFDILHQISLGS